MFDKGKYEPGARPMADPDHVLTPGQVAAATKEFSVWPSYPGAFVRKLLASHEALREQRDYWTRQAIASKGEIVQQNKRLREQLQEARGVIDQMTSEPEAEALKLRIAHLTTELDAQTEATLKAEEESGIALDYVSAENRRLRDALEHANATFDKIIEVCGRTDRLAEISGGE